MFEHGKYNVFNFFKMALFTDVVAFKSCLIMQFVFNSPSAKNNEHFISPILTQVSVQETISSTKMDYSFFFNFFFLGKHLKWFPIPKGLMALNAKQTPVSSHWKKCDATLNRDSRSSLLKY